MVFRFPDTLISKIFYLYHSHFRPLLFSPIPIKFFLVINRVIINYGVIFVHIVNYGLLCGHPDHNNPWYRKGCRFVVCSAVLGHELLPCYPSSCFWTVTLDLLSDCFSFRWWDINVDLWIRAHPPFCFSETFLKCLTHGFSNTFNTVSK